MDINRNCVFYGNCQVAIHLHDKMKGFLNNYQVFSYVNNDRLNGLNIIELNGVDLDILKKCSLFIYQPLNSKHGVYSTDHIMKFLPKNCIKISIPYVYNSSIYTTYWEPASQRWRLGTLHNCGWKNIMLMIKNGSSSDDILNMYDEGSLDFYFEERMDTCIESLMEKEEECSIKVSDFILNNFRHKRLFLTQNHLSDYFIAYIANKILKYLNISKSLDCNEGVESSVEQGCVLDRYNKSLFNYNFTYSDRETKAKIVDFCNFFTSIKDNVSKRDIKPYKIKKEQPEKFIDHDL